MIKYLDNLESYLSKHNMSVILIEIIAIVLVAYILSKVVNKIFKKSHLNEKLNFNFLRSIIKAVIWVLAIVAILAVIPGMDKLATTLVAGSGVVAVIITLGAQESFANIISGLIMVTSKPFDIGDRLIIKDGSIDIIGFVEDITLRHTVIRTFKNTEYVITNSKLDSMIIENTTRYSNNNGIVDFVDVKIAYESDLSKAIDIMKEVVGNHHLFFDARTEEEKTNNVDKVTVRVRSLTDNGISLRVSVRTKSIDDSFSACSECRELIKKEFDSNNIEIPYNKVVVIEQ